MIFRDDYYFLSNMYPTAIHVLFRNKHYTFSCNEAAYQAMKCPERIEEFTRINGYEAKRLGRRVQCRPDWNSIKLAVMQKLISIKFAQHPELQKKLNTISEPIVETNTWGDCYWGVCKGTGENHLGKILEEQKGR